jgi:hypothetical protein
VSIGRWYRSIVGTSRHDERHSLPQAPHDIGRCSTSDGSDNPAAVVTGTRALAAEDAGYVGCKDRLPVCRTRQSWTAVETIVDAGHAGAAAQDQYQSMIDVGRRVGHSLIIADDLEKARVGDEEGSGQRRSRT